MKAVNKRTTFIIIPAILLIISVCLISNINNQEERLNEAQIAALREKYPICCVKIPTGVEMATLSLSDVKNTAETFVYGEVVGDVKTYTVKLSTGNSMLDEKRKENGISEEFEFYEYTISVINDTEGKKERGENITIAANTMFKDYNPQLSSGMKIVVPVITDKEKSTRHYFVADGMYYVTEEGYAISVFEEETTSSRNITSGVKVEELLRMLKK